MPYGIVVPHRHMCLLAALATLLLSIAAQPSTAKELGLCKFDAKTLAFAGTPTQQAACLLRRVKPKGAGSDPQTIPTWLSDRVGKDTKISPTSFTAFLASRNIDPNALGGPIQAVDLPEKRYLVIHDTSSPELKNVKDFPPGMDQADWPGNSLKGWASTALRVNVITNRAGQSRTLRDFKATRPKPATKLEEAGKLPQARKVFVQIENIQPRIKPKGSWAYVAPTPGFSAAQMERLALIYVAASIRSGRWLIPAFHFNLDQGIKGGHDDPQNFDLPAWSKAVAAIVTELGGSS